MSGGADRLSAAKQVYSHSNFKMMVWLVIFYDFFDKGVSLAFHWIKR